MDELERARAEIAGIDDQILALLVVRVERVRRLHAWKRARGVPLRDGGQEARLLARLRAAGEAAGLDGGWVEGVFGGILMGARGR